MRRKFKKILFLKLMEKAPARDVKLRLVTESDAQLLFDLMTSKTWLNNIGDRGIKTVEDAGQYIINKMHPDLHEKGFVNHVIVDSETKKEVGTCSLHNREGVEGLDVGFAILEPFQGKGYATLPAQKMIELAINTYHAESVSAITTDENLGSCAVLEKLGFKHSGYLKLPMSAQSFKLCKLLQVDFRISD